MCLCSGINVAPSSCSLGLGEAQGGALGEGRHTSFCALAAPPLPGLEPCSRASMNDMAAGFRHHSRPLAAGWPDSCYTAAPALAPRQNGAASADPPPAGCTIGAPGGALDLGRLKTAAWTTARSTASCSARVQLRISSGGVEMSLLHRFGALPQKSACTTVFGARAMRAERQRRSMHCARAWSQSALSHCLSANSHSLPVSRLTGNAFA